METIKQNYLGNLNKNQEEAIINIEGPCLIVAGAGSGKTKVLTTRVVHLIKEKKAWPNQILCVTFTNKAAREMQMRITSALNEKVSSLPLLSGSTSVINCFPDDGYVARVLNSSEYPNKDSLNCESI